MKIDAQRCIPVIGRIDFLLLLAVLIAGFALFNALKTHTRLLQSGRYNAKPIEGVDYFQFWTVAKAVRTIHPDNIYSEANRRRMYEFAESLASPSEASPGRLAVAVRYGQGTRRQRVETFSTPFLYTVIDLLTLHQPAQTSWPDRYAHDFDQYHLICMAAYVGAVLALCLSLEYPLSWSLLFMAIGYFWFRPLKLDMDVGNVAQLQLGAMALYILLRIGRPGTVRDLICGLILGLLTAFKPNLAFVPLLLGIAWILDRRWRTLAIQTTAAIAGLLIAFIWGSLFLGTWSAWPAWVAAISHINQQATIILNHGNFSLAQLILQLTGIHSSMALILAALVLAIWALATSRNKHRADFFHRDYLVASIGCAIALLALPLVWVHYYVLFLPLVIYLFSPALVSIRGRGRNAERILAALTLLVLFLTPINRLIGMGAGYLAAALFIGAAWMLFFLCLGYLRPSVAPALAAGTQDREAPEQAIYSNP